LVEEFGTRLGSVEKMTGLPDLSAAMEPVVVAAVV